MRLCWTKDAWADYIWLQENDKRLARRVNKLLEDALRHPFEGLGKPEPLKFNYSACWSRRIDVSNRLIYAVKEDDFIVLSAKDHYDDK